MLIEKDKLFAELARYDAKTVRAAYIAMMRFENGRILSLRQRMRDNGFELLDVSEDQPLTADGREILRAHGKSWALCPEIHAARLAEALDQARQRAAAMAAQQQKQQAPATVCQAIIDGQLCGGTLSATPVCPKCSLGKQGVSQIMTCDVCGTQTAVMR